MKKNTTTNLLLIFTILVISSSIAQAVIIESTTANQITYKDGDLILIKIQTNAENLTITADFAAVDTGFNAKSVIIEPSGMEYDIYYPITFKNTKGDATYNAIITVYDAQTSTTSSVTYGIRIENLDQRQTDSIPLTLTVNDEDMISVKSGTVQVCTNTKCTTFTQSEYDALRNIYISSGKVSLSNLTYNQLRDEISASANAKIDANLKAYLVELATIRQTLDAGLYDLKMINKDMKNFTEYQKNETIKTLKQGNRNNLISVIAVFLMICAGLYVIYLRTETTWFARPK